MVNKLFAREANHGRLLTTKTETETDAKPNQKAHIFLFLFFYTKFQKLSHENYVLGLGTKFSSTACSFFSIFTLTEKKWL